MKPMTPISVPSLSSLATSCDCCSASAPVPLSSFISCSYSKTRIKTMVSCCSCRYIPLMCFLSKFSQKITCNFVLITFRLPVSEEERGGATDNILPVLLFNNCCCCEWFHGNKMRDKKSLTMLERKGMQNGYDFSKVQFLHHYIRP